MGPDVLVFFWLIIMTMSICAVIFGQRYMRNKETMAMIEKGLDPNIKPERPRPAPFRSLKWGLLLVGAGLGLFFAYLFDNTLLYHVGHYVSRYGGGDYEVNGANVSLYFAFIAVGGGLGLITSYRIEKKELLDKGK
jgi:ABC-type Fe3+ transport system permease subunit